MVDPKEFLKDMVGFQKKTFEKSCTIMETYQKTPEKTVRTFQGKSFDATKDMYSQYLATFIKKNLMKTTDENN